MKKRRSAAGYTIVEVMIVLGVTAILLVSALTLVGGQQSKTQFRESSIDIQSNIDQVINNVQTGYYSRPQNLSCSASISGPVFASAATNRGSNQSCIFLGRAMQLAVNGDRNSYNVYNLAGLRINSSGQSVSSIDETLPTAISIGGATNNYGGFTDTTELKSIQYGYNVKSMSYKLTASSMPAPTSIVAFITDFPSSSSANTNNSSSRVAELYAISNTTNVTDLETASPVSQVIGVDRLSEHSTGPYLAVNYRKVNSVFICMDSDSLLYSILTIGGGHRQLTTNLRFVDKSTSPPECA